jgi:hypothetical protein
LLKKKKKKKSKAPHLMRVVPQSVVTLVVYEQAISLIKALGKPNQ